MGIKLDILAIGVHPDDVELGCSGVLLRELKNGKKTGILDLTQGELGSRGTVETRYTEAANAAMRGNIVRLHVASLAANMILELAPHGVETIADGDVDVLMGMVLRRIALHHDLVPRHFEIDPDVIEIAMAAPIWRLNDDAAAHDTIEELLEFPSPLANLRLHSGRGIDIAECDLKPGWHGHSS